MSVLALDGEGFPKRATWVCFYWGPWKQMASMKKVAGPRVPALAPDSAESQRQAENTCLKQKLSASLAKLGIRELA